MILLLYLQKLSEFLVIGKRNPYYHLIIETLSLESNPCNDEMSEKEEVIHFDITINS